MPTTHGASCLRVPGWFLNPSRFDDISGFLGSGAGRGEVLLLPVICVMSCCRIGSAVVFSLIGNTNSSKCSVGGTQLFPGTRALN